MKNCPYCAEEIQDAAVVCRFCNRELQAAQTVAPVAKKTHPLAIGCLGVLGLFVLFAIIGSFDDSTGSPTRQNSTSNADENRVAGSPSIALLSTNGFQTEGGGYHNVEGQVTNLTDASIDNVVAVASWFTKSGDFITSDQALIDFNPLLPGQTSPFKTMSRTNPEMATYRVEFKRLNGGTLGVRDDRKTK